MTIKERIVEKWNKIDGKLNFRRFKFHYFAVVLVLFAIPLTVILAENQTNSSTRAQAPSANVLASEEAFYEDFTPADPFVAPDALTEVNANAVDAEASVVATTKKPNIVMILLDDVNPLDGRMWSQSIMPNIYSIFVAKGINFTNFYGETTLCCPGRAGFLTGQHTQNHGVADLDGTKFKPGETIATKLESKGYYTMLTGKYLNFFNAIPQKDAIPPGWTKFDALYNNNGKYYDYRIISKIGSSSTIKKYGQTASDYSTDVETNIAIKRLKEAPANKPIFAYIAPTAAHGPQTMAPRYKDDKRCDNITWTPPNFNEKDVSDKPQYVKDLPLLVGSKATGSLKVYCQTLLAVDQMVGRIKKELVREGRLQNTVFILTADNGMGWGEHRIGVKTVPYATHIPLYISWPAGRGSQPIVNPTTLSNIDFAATFCEIAGCVMGSYPNGQKTSDGLSFLPLLKNQPVTWFRDTILESQPIKPVDQAGPSTRPAWWAIRTTETNPLGRWHYVEYGSGERELYDVSNGPCITWVAGNIGDPCELNNLLSPNATTVADASLVSYLSSALSQLKNEKGATVQPAPPGIKSKAR